MGFLIAVLTVLVMMCFYPPLQKVFSRWTRGIVSTAAMPWIGLGLAFLLCLRIVPMGRGVIFGTTLIAIATLMQFVAPKKPKVKLYIMNAFFSGNDIWAEQNIIVYLSALWTAGIILLIPIGSLDMILNIGALAVAAGWFIWHGYKGATKKKEQSNLPESKTAQ